MTDSNKRPLFSVVTVCFNSGDMIRKTIESVLAQDFAGTDTFFVCKNTSADAGSVSYHGFEYVIQDGASNDNTLSIIDEYRDNFNEKGITLTVNTGKDGGIYDAMNKAVSSCKGEYVIFMNADDCFYSESVLSDVCSSLRTSLCADSSLSPDIEIPENGLPDIIFGDCIVKELGFYFKFIKCYDKIKERMPFSHQACFAKSELLIKNPLKAEYRITADYCFLLENHLAGSTFFDSDITVALVTADGLSSIHMLDTFIEVNKVCNSLSVPRYSEGEFNSKLKEMKLKQFVLSHFPKSIVKYIRKKQITSRGQSISESELDIPSWAK